MPLMRPVSAAALLGAALVGPCRAGLCTEEQFARFPGGWPAELDASLYWFTRDDVPQKAVEGSTGDFYDPSRRTVVFFHGYTGHDGGSVQTCDRASTLCPHGACQDKDTPMMQSWFDAGWNVGIFYWDQFADEECARDAEQKIWFDRKGDGLTWKSYDTQTGQMSRKSYLGDVMSVADLCVNAFWTALASHSGPEVRFVGHSIGAQLAVRCASMLHQQNHPAAPQRLALLEPYFTKHHLWLFRCVGKTDVSTDEGVGNFAPLATSDYAKHLYDTKGVITEVYKTSVYTEMTQFGNPNADLEKFATFVQYEPRWCGGNSVLGHALAKVDVRHVGCKHYAAIPLYFLGFDQTPPTLAELPSADSSHPTSALKTCPTPAASCKYGELKQWVERQLQLATHDQKWKQEAGFETISVDDDRFRLTPLDDPPTAEFIKAAVLNTEWAPIEHKGRAATLTASVITRAPLLLLVVFALVASKFVHTFFFLHGVQQEDEDDSDVDVYDPAVTKRLMKVKKHEEATFHRVP